MAVIAETNAGSELNRKGSGAAVAALSQVPQRPAPSFSLSASISKSRRLAPKPHRRADFLYRLLLCRLTSAHPRVTRRSPCLPARYFFASSARREASFAEPGSFGSANPTSTTFAFGSLCKRTAASSSTRLQTLSARALPGRNEQSLILLACGGAGGCCTVTDVEQSAAPPAPFSTRPVTV